MENQKPSSSTIMPFETDSRNIYDVFLSFKGEDTRASFTSHLCFALRISAIKVFIDDNEIQRGDHISTALSRAIELSRISIIVFSKNYADSRWCLDELRKIIKCHRTRGQVVLPVFYHVDPSEVRHQKGEFGNAFQSLLDEISDQVELVLSWRETLHQAANIAGFVILNSGNESEDVKTIVDKVSHLLNKTDLFVANNPVGIESRVQDVVQLLHTQSNSVLLLGMWGMGGIGKTTIAKAIYNKIGRNFEGEAIELFSWNAFKQASPRGDFDEISRNVVEYSGGLPLALEVLGSYLFDRGLTEWYCVLEKLKRIPNVQVQNNLVTVDDTNKLGMHDLLRDMGREIIREESPMKPAQRRRLWFNEDVLHVLSEQTGTQDIEGLALNLLKADANHFNTKAFEKMNRLRLLQLTGVQLDGDFDYLSRKLRWLCWKGFPLTCIPINLYQGNLVSMELENSNIKLVWEDNQRMEKLKILNLSHSHYLTHTPDFSYLPNLENYPNWLAFNCEGSSVTFEVPQVEGRMLKEIIICIVYSSTPDNIASDGLTNMLVKNYTKTTIQLYKSEALVAFEDEEGQRVVSSIEPRDKVEVVLVFKNGFVVNKTAVYLIYESYDDEPIAEIVEECPAQDKNAVVGSILVKEASPQLALVYDLAHNKRKTLKEWLGKYRCC
ncbi:hypothetical protein TSUD_285510 [Trifolium subterraneum]|uniref:TIR domain-containing protein n=1 Tax=Trifolium subterraneum TaxID=3900 RepID=A0A2Z6PFC7_TRISU|nr:hypothetical protein TSUD_285510 [Trifolium subterraneum]